MTAARKRRVPANDQRAKSAERMSCVRLPRSAWDAKKIASALVLGFFVLILGIVVAASQKTIFGDETASIFNSSEPFDIKLSSPPPELKNVSEQKVPKKQTIVFPLNRNMMQPILNVTVEDGVGGKDDAESQAKIALSLMNEGNLGQAIEHQHRAVELNPSDMRYRLELAVMHDRLSDKSGASALYRQVVQAYEVRDASLPQDLDIESVRSRLEYLIQDNQ
jgi:hypothetical protein